MWVSSSDQMECVRSIHDGIGDQALVESQQLTTVRARERKQVTIRHLRGI
jgi:hypothetical protein